MIATAIRAAMRPYSMAVTPSSFWSKGLNQSKNKVHTCGSQVEYLNGTPVLRWLAGRFDFRPAIYFDPSALKSWRR